MSESVEKTEFSVTVGFVITLIIVYLISSFPFFTQINDYFVYWGALIPGSLHNLQLWRLFSANLLHADINHLFFNCISILIWGHLLEKFIGSKGFLTLLFFSGLATTVTSAVMSPEKVSLGASGIAYGFMSALIVLIVILSVLKDPSSLKGQLFSVLILLVIQLLYNFNSPVSLDLWGHLGGAVAGILFIIAFLIYIKLINNFKNDKKEDLES